MEPSESPKLRRAVLITGAGGSLGRTVTRLLASDPRGLERIVATDIRLPPARERLSGVSYRELDVRATAVEGVLRDEGIDTVIHLAAIVTPGPDEDRQIQYSVDVLGTRNVIASCVAADVRKLVYTSSGAAYGYHPDAPALLTEDSPLRGNEVFAYAHHKRLVEDELEKARVDHPELEQLVLRVSTVLGLGISNQITAMFERPVVLGLTGADTPFCFVWDEDVARCIVEKGVHGDGTGIFNITGDGVMTLREIAVAMGRRYVALPERLVRRALGVLSHLQLTGYGPEQTLFLRHRPVLSNRRLKEDLGFVPGMTSREAFETYRRSRP